MPNIVKRLASLGRQAN